METETQPQARQKKVTTYQLSSVGGGLPGPQQSGLDFLGDFALGGLYSPGYDALTDFTSRDPLRESERDDPCFDGVQYRAGARARDLFVDVQNERAYQAGRNAPLTDYRDSVYRNLGTGNWERYADPSWRAENGGRYQSPGDYMLYTSPSVQENEGEMRGYARDGQSPMVNRTMVEQTFDARGGMADVSNHLDELGLTRSAFNTEKGQFHTSLTTGDTPWTKSGQGAWDAFLANPRQHAGLLAHSLLGEHPYMHSRALAEGVRDNPEANSLRVPSATGGDQIDLFPERLHADQLQYRSHVNYDGTGMPGATLVDPRHLNQHSATGTGRGVLPPQAPAGGWALPNAHPAMSPAGPYSSSPERYFADSSGKTQRGGSARYTGLAAAGFSARDNFEAWRHGDVGAGEALLDTALDGGVGTATGMIDDALTRSLGGGMKAGFKAGGVIDAVTSGVVSTWDNAGAYDRGEINASQATANAVVDTGVGVASGLAGAAAGAAIGSVVPVVGTAIGAVLGLGAGMLASWGTNALLEHTGATGAAKEGLGSLLSGCDDSLRGTWDNLADTRQDVSRAWDGATSFLGLRGDGTDGGRNY